MALRAHGTEVEILNALETHPDCCFVEDCAVMIDGVALISNLGAPSRRGEEVAVAEYLSGGSDILRMPAGATLDGGDVVFFDDRYLIGVSTRTNQAGADFLTEQVREEGFDVELIDIPSSTLHLTTVCSSPREGTLVAAEGHLSEDQVGHLADEILWVPNSDSYAANTIGYSGDRVIIADGYASTRQVMLDAGFSITSVDMDAIRQADGSLTCLSVFNR
jgi:dimethylargininase|tara:strand:+ start:3781 stop:4437 length:657 start_codon:yes stop_codon:yes gene_type:complete